MSGVVRFVRRRGWTLLWLTLGWVLLWGRFTVGNLVGGVLVAVLVLVVFPLPAVRLGIRVHPWRVLTLAGVLAVDLVRSAYEVSVVALRPRSTPLHNAVVEVPLRTDSDLVLTLTAQVLSLVPGSLVLEADQRGHRLWLHVLAVDQAGGVERWRERALRLEARVAAALGVPLLTPPGTVS